MKLLVAKIILGLFFLAVAACVIGMIVAEPIVGILLAAGFSLMWAVGTVIKENV